MSIAIRPLHQLDYDPAVTLCSAVDPERGADLKESLQRADEPSQLTVSPVRRWVTVDDRTGQLVGYAACWNTRRRKHRMELMVHPERRRQGIGSELLSTLLADLWAAQAETLQARVWGDSPESLQFLQHRGFSEVHRMYELRLDLREADLVAFADLPARLAAQGIQVSTLREEGAKGERFWARMLDLQNAAMSDWPDPDPDGVATVYTEREFRQVFASWQVIPDAFFIAKAGGRYVGYSGLGADGRGGDTIGSGPTAVRPEYRGLGVATALKVLSLSWAKGRGYLAAVSRSANPAMIRVNEKVGFRRGRSEVRLVRKLILP
jgi:GNAT superfamily N-acetyltransferase